MTNANDATRNKLLDTALTLFADRGFNGVSIANIASEIGVTKQALLHHFGSKERLYGEVLKSVAHRLTAVFSGLEPSPNKAPYDVALQAFYTHMMAHEDDARIVMRELLDNTDRAEDARKWYFRDFLETLLELAATHPRWKTANRASVMAGVYQHVGAINYFAISRATLTGIFGADEVTEMTRAFPGALQ